jgi:hypothetical protein
MVEPAIKSVASAPVTASGTARSTVNGCTSDSNCDARTMNTTTSASPNAKYSAPPLSSSSRDSPASAVVLPRGNTSAASRLSESSASPSVNPGARLAVRVKLRTRWKWFSSRGPTPSLMLATASSLISWLFRPRT